MQTNQMTTAQTVHIAASAARRILRRQRGVIVPYSALRRLGHAKLASDPGFKASRAWQAGDDAQLNAMLRIELVEHCAAS